MCYFSLAAETEPCFVDIKAENDSTTGKNEERTLKSKEHEYGKLLVWK